MKKILLFGSSGQLGSEIRNIFFDSKEFEIISFDKDKFDFSSKSSLEQFLENEEFDYLVNAMGMTNTGLCEDEIELAYRLNAIRVGEMAQACAKRNATMFHFSTDYVFDGSFKNPLSENDLPNPISVYGASKLAGEYHASMYHEKLFVFRISSLYGAGGQNFVKTMLGKAKRGEEINVVIDQYMSPTHSLDVAKVVKTFIEREIEDFGLYHCSGEGVCSWYEFTAEIMRQAGFEVKIGKVSHKDFPAKLKRPEYSEMSNEKISKYYKMPAWEESLGEFLNIIKDQK